MTAQSTSGQMKPGPNMMNKNMSGTMEWNRMSIMKDENITGSINLMSTISKAILSEVKVSLSDTGGSAEKSVGNGSHAAVRSYCWRQWIPSLQHSGSRTQWQVTQDYNRSG